MSTYSTTSSSSRSSLHSPVATTPNSATFPHNAHCSAQKKRLQESLRLNPIGIHPSEMIGKVLKRISRSDKHPTVTLYFTDNTSFQIRVDGYNPMYPGLPKQIETDPALEPIFSRLEDDTDPVAFTISHAVMTTLTDRAFQKGEKDSHWDQHHSAVAFKFAEEGRWHCVWVTMEEHDGPGTCIFRSFDDVYLDKLDPSQGKKKKRNNQKKKGRKSGKL
ncbi:hypothetical protein C8Q75DRAFT_882321 [Abortiporus biennis]|nr:hypothetical protein C8Q75DRAFT_882321 [Abortiporus biennis]